MIYLPSNSLLRAIITAKTHLISNLPGVPKTQIFSSQSGVTAKEEEGTENTTKDPVAWKQPWVMPKGKGMTKLL